MECTSKFFSVLSVLTLFTAQTTSASPSSIPIIGGVAVDDQDQTEVRRSTVALITTVYDSESQGTDETTGAGCSGTLVNDHFILTARHCFTGSLNPTGMVPNATHQVIFSTTTDGQTFTFKSAAVTIAKSTYLDLALIDLSTIPDFKVPSDYKSAKIYSELPPVEALVTLAGFGIRSDNYDSIQNDPILAAKLAYGTLYQVEGHVYGYGIMAQDLYGKKSNLDFDPRKSDEILIAGSGETGTCHGDSGGPTYIKMSDGSYQVVGVTSWGMSLTDNAGDPIDGSCDTSQPDREIYLGGKEAKAWLTKVLGSGY